MRESKKNETFKSYLSVLSATKRINYSLWKATRHTKRPLVPVRFIRKGDGTWARSEDKAKIYTHHLERVFQLKTIKSELDILEHQQLNAIREKSKYFIPLEVSKEIDNKLNPKKSAGCNEFSKKKKCLMSPQRKSLFITRTRTTFFCPRNKYQNNINGHKLFKPSKLPEDITSFLLSMSKLSEKLLLKYLEPILKKNIVYQNINLNFTTNIR